MNTSKGENMYAAEIIAEAREWLLDCFNDDDSIAEIEHASDETIVRGVDKYYEGGWEAFLAAA